MNNIVLRMNILGGMNELVAEFGDEEVLENWITFGVPDAATEDDLQAIAEDDECFTDVCKHFVNLLETMNYLQK